MGKEQEEKCERFFKYKANEIENFIAVYKRRREYKYVYISIYGAAMTTKGDDYDLSKKRKESERKRKINKHGM